MLKKVLINPEKNSYNFEDGKIYGIPLSLISKKSIFINGFGYIGRQHEIGDKSIEEYASMVLYNNGYNDAIDSNRDLDYIIFTKELDLPEDIILCRYNKNNDSFIDETTKIEFPFFTEDNKNEEDCFLSGTSIQDFEIEYKKGLENPLVIDDADFHNLSIFEDNDDLRKISHNEKYKEILLKIFEEAKINLQQQFKKTIEIDQIVAKLEDNIKHNGMSR